MKTRVAVLGAAGYIGGELLRLLIGHPDVAVAAAVSSRFPGKRIETVHPNLRSNTDLIFRTERDAASETYDAVLLATPHKATAPLMARWIERAETVIDLSGDFRLRDPEVYRAYYGIEHPAPDLLAGFTPGIPEFHRERLRTANRISVPGCGAIAGLLALAPLADRGLIGPRVEIDVRTGSSGSGATAGEGNLHAERSGAMRVFAPTGHRHEAEIRQFTGLDARMSATGVEAVRGLQLLCRAEPAPGVDELAIRRAYREAYREEPFVRIVAHRRGGYRYPEPKILLGSNFCDVGAVLDPDSGRLAVIAALDNLVKGGAGNAVQCLNIRTGRPERTGLGFTGLHPL